MESCEVELWNELGLLRVQFWRQVEVFAPAAAQSFAWCVSCHSLLVFLGSFEQLDRNVVGAVWGGDPVSPASVPSSSLLFPSLVFSSWSFHAEYVIFLLQTNEIIWFYLLNIFLVEAVPARGMGWSWMSFKVSSTPNQSGIPWISKKTFFLIYLFNAGV